MTISRDTADLIHDVATKDASNTFALDQTFTGRIIVENGGTAAATGAVRLSNNNSIAWRNAADTNNNTLVSNTNDNLTYKGNEIYDTGNDSTLVKTNVASTIDGYQLTVDNVPLTIAAATWANGWLKIGDGTAGIAMDANEIYGNTTLNIGTIGAGDLIFNPFGDVKINGADLIPNSDNTGAVGTAAVTWANGQFTNFTIDNDLTVSNDIKVTNDVIVGDGSGAVGLTINDGQGNCNVTFNHANGTADQAGNCGRIVVNTDSTTSASMKFELKTNAAAGAVTTDEILVLTETLATFDNDLTVGGEIIDTTAWTNLTLLNSWVNYGGGHASAQYRQGADGTVEVKGLVKDGTAVNAVIATLPVGFRPSTNRIFAAAAAAGHARLDISSNGNIVCPTGASFSWTSIQCTFKPD